jgi:pimeloyl-ACP methyl ester carboxylesterase
MIEWNLENYRNGQLVDQVIQPDLQAATAIDRVTMPVLVMWGTLDVKSAAINGEWLVANVPAVERHVFEGVAHMVNLERPAEFNRILRDFLDGVER